MYFTISCAAPGTASITLMPFLPCCFLSGTNVTDFLVWDLKNTIALLTTSRTGRVGGWGGGRRSGLRVHGDCEEDVMTGKLF